MNFHLAELANVGLDVTLVSSGGEGVEDLSLAERHVTVPISRDIAPISDLRALFLLYKLFAREKFDIVHSDTPKAGILVALAARLARIEIRLHTWTGQRWATMDRSLPRSLLRGIDRVIGMLNTACFADSESQMEYLIAEGIVTSDEISVIGGNSNAGVDLERFDITRIADWRAQSRQKVGLPQDATVLVFVGRLTRDKGVLELIQAFRQLAERFEDLYLLLVGPYDQEIGGSASVSSSDIEVHDRILTTGHVTDPESFLAAGDIFCLPSYREGFGTVVIEAAAMGLPSVATRIVGLIDAVEDGRTGVLVGTRDVAELAAALENLIENPQVRSRLGEAARQRAVELFDESDSSEAMILAYRQMLSGTGFMSNGQ